MSRLTDLISQVKTSDPELGKELEREFKTLSSRLPFGLNFERHTPESVELPGRPIRKGDKVHILPPRGSTKKGDQRLWRVMGFTKKGDVRVASLELIRSSEPESQQVSVDDLVVVAEFRDYIYPGLVSTGKVERGGDKPFHTVINAENFHALEALTFTHRGKIDAIYIDPPYNTGAKDWKYNNDYVEGEDIYRHSKWLAMMERRLLTARELLNPEDSVLIVTIDEKEYLRLGLLLEQVFPDARIQMVSIQTNPSGVRRAGEFRRSDEYAYFVRFGGSIVSSLVLGPDWEPVRRKAMRGLEWNKLRRTGTNTKRSDRPNLFYPIFINEDGISIHSVGNPLGPNEDRHLIELPTGTDVAWPLRQDGTEGNWQISPSALQKALQKGYVRLGGRSNDSFAMYYLKAGEQRRVESGEYKILDRRSDGSIVAERTEVYAEGSVPTTQWMLASHDAATHGSRMLRTLLLGRSFPFPKSLYAVEDELRFFIANKPKAVILDFFSGSGTTAHAVMRLNKQDGGRRQCISVTNNEVAADEQKRLREQGLRPGDADWEKWGICDYITKPRIEAAITGKTPDGEPIKGDYKFTDEFPMADGFDENAEFFTLTYEAPIAVSHNHAFARIAPLLWMKAGSTGERIDDLPKDGWAVVETYGLLIDLDKASKFCKEVDTKEAVRTAFIVTDDDRRFQSVARRLPQDVEPVRLYEAYLNNFRFSLRQ